MASSTYRRLPPPAPLPPPLQRPPVPPVDPDDQVIARTALELGLPEALVRGWLGRAGELGRRGHVRPAPPVGADHVRPRP